ncbi:alcohol dehydrogenase catalytic domain-containing protein [Streptomyces sp. NPDC002018]|uniref:alcohol dehydrogenase catalytic domain-containing protein n=1 Tax=Streptomyces sp. NPDC002018 TaxID=3364629 RepID=UPI003677AD29
MIRTAASSLRTAASSLNPVDWKTRAGEAGSELPATPGWDLAGVVTVTATGYPGYRPRRPCVNGATHVSEMWWQAMAPGLPYRTDVAPDSSHALRSSAMRCRGRLLGGLTGR